MFRFTNFDEEIKQGSEKQTPHTPPTQDPKQTPSEPRSTDPEKESY